MIFEVGHRMKDTEARRGRAKYIYIYDGKRKENVVIQCDVLNFENMEK